MRNSVISSHGCATRAATLLAGAVCAMLALTAPAAWAKKPPLCENQSFSQFFLAENNPHFYTPVPGGEFNSPEEGWTFSGGASVVESQRPGESNGGVLSLPAGGAAISPQMCVTLAYPSAAAWLYRPAGAKAPKVSVSYAGTTSELEPLEVGVLRGRRETWTLDMFGLDRFAVEAEGVEREVRLVFEGGGKGTVYLYGVYIDPRLGR